MSEDGRPIFCFPTSRYYAGFDKLQSRLFHSQWIELYYYKHLFALIPGTEGALIFFGAIGGSRIPAE